jgi:serine protease Do
MHLRTILKFRLLAICLTGCSLLHAVANDVSAENDPRMTPLVKAVRNCSMSVVNLRGRKTVRADDAGDGSVSELKQVNGMGTGVVIDSRGYVLTNYHVVQGVREIEVTTADRQRTTAKLLAHDPETDLAILKVDLARPLPRIEIGTSSDLMLAETVTAVGNAYGYEHTVTVGIISQLGRTVQVNDDQVYRNLIQTDAAINPGNSGGPLLNMNGKMIGINVAVRIGAQGIAFAIPVNDALDVAAELMETMVDSRVFHGMALRTIYVDEEPQVVVTSVAASSPAANAGVERGVRIVEIDGRPVNRAMDISSSLLELVEPSRLTLKIQDGKTVDRISFDLEQRKLQTSSLAWSPLGLKLAPVSAAEMEGRHPNYKRGLRVIDVREDSPAESEGIMVGDVIVAMHGWKTETVENLAYILEREDINKQKNFMFYILRDNEPFWGQIRVAQRHTR